MNLTSSLVAIDNAARWDEFVARHDGHLLQSFAWGELKSRFGWRAERWGWTQDDSIRAGAQILFRRLLPAVTLAYVPRGPVLADLDEDSAVAFSQQLREVARSRGAFLFKIEPDWLRENPRDRALDRVGFSHSTETIQPSATIRLDLTPEPDAILAAMKPKWRYNIRLAEKKGVVVRAGTDADLPAFFELTRITGERDRFAVHSSEYYRAAFELLATRDDARLLIAEFQQQALAMIFVTAFGHEAIYLYGASGNEHRNVMPNHALHWAAIQWAKARGCTRYDLWGVPENAEQADANLPSSLYQFKQGFGGEVVYYSGAWDCVNSPVQYGLYRAARRARRSGLG